MPWNKKQQVSIKSFSDADYANDQSSRKSITGMITLVNGVPVQWLVR